MKYTDELLQRQLAEVQQSLIQFKSTQVSTTDTWMPYTSSVSAGYQFRVAATATTTWHYFRITFLQETPEPALSIFYALTTGYYEMYQTFTWGSAWIPMDYRAAYKLTGYNVGDTFTNKAYVSLMDRTFTQSDWNNMRNIEDPTITVYVASTQPGTMKIEEIDEATYRKEALDF